MWTDCKAETLTDSMSPIVFMCDNVSPYSSNFIVVRVIET